MGKGTFGSPIKDRKSLYSIPVRNIIDNLEVFDLFSDIKNGYLGEKYSKDKILWHRRIETKNPLEYAQSLFMKLSRGGVAEIIRDKEGNEKGIRVSMANGDVITFRPQSVSDKSPVIDINIRSPASCLKSQIIHFYERRKNEKDNK